MVYTGPLKDKKHATVEFFKQAQVDAVLDSCEHLGAFCQSIANADARLRESIRNNETPAPTQIRGFTPNAFAVSPEGWMGLPKKQNDDISTLSVSKIPEREKDNLIEKVSALIQDNKLGAAYNLVKNAILSRAIKVVPD